MRYRFDAALSRGPAVVISWLGLVTLSVIVISALTMALFRLHGINGDEKPLGFFEAFWQSLLRVIDGGTFAGDKTPLTRLVALLITLCGIFLAGSLIGLIASSVDHQIDELRKGRSAVVEDDHTLILGWSPRVPAVVSELVVANASRKKAAVVVLAGQDKTEMEEALRDRVGDFGSTRLVCRSGDTADPRALDLVNARGARSIIIVGADDAATVKTLLALRTMGGDDAERHIVAEMADEGITQSTRSLFGPRLVAVNSDSVVAELTAQACRQRGLSAVFRELLDFDGDEVYFAPFAQLVGQTYATAQLSFDKSAVFGLLRNGRVQLNPPADTVIAAGDELIAIAPDDSEFTYSGVAPVSRRLEHVDQGRSSEPRRIIVAGWSGLGPRVIEELDEFLGPETTLELMLDPDRVDIAEVRESIDVHNVAVEISELRGGPELVAAQAARRAFNEVIVLGYRQGMTADEADARTLLTLLAFSQVRRDEAVGPVRMVAELLDQRHATLATATGADDFIVSDELTSLMLAQLSERLELIQVFDDLFDREGSTIESRPAIEYGAVGTVTFAEIVESASRRGHSAIGYRQASSGAVVLNLSKAANVELSNADEVIVVSS